MIYRRMSVFFLNGISFSFIILILILFFISLEYRFLLLDQLLEDRSTKNGLKILWLKIFLLIPIKTIHTAIVMNINNDIPTTSSIPIFPAKNILSGSGVFFARMSSFLLGSIRAILPFPLVFFLFRTVSWLPKTSWNR